MQSNPCSNVPTFKIVPEEQKLLIQQRENKLISVVIGVVDKITRLESESRPSVAETEFFPKNLKDIYYYYIIVYGQTMHCNWKQW